MDIYEKILDDHHNIREAIEDLMETDNSQIEKRNRLMDDLERLFVSHINSEEQTLYQSLSELSDREVKAQIKKSRKEHSDARQLLDKVKEISLDSDIFLERLEDFKNLIESHFDEEEDEVFDMARDLLSIDEAHLLEEEMEDFEDTNWNQPQY